MSSAIKYFTMRRSFFFMFIGLAVFVAYLYFFAGFDQIVVILHGVNKVQYAFFYSLAISSMLLANLFWVASWRNVLKTLSVKITLKNAFLYYWSGYFVDLVVPCETVCGELTRMYLVHRESDYDYGVIAAGGVTNRIIAYIIVVTGLYTSAGLLFLKSNIPSIVLSVFILILIGATLYLVVLLYLAFSEKSAGRIASFGLKILKVLRPKKYQSSDLSTETKNSLSKFYIGFKTFRDNPKHLIKPLIYMSVSWLLNLSEYLLVFFALNIFHQPLSFFIIVYFVAGSVTDAVAGFSVGTLEILLATIFVLYGLSPALSAVTAALVRSVTFWAPLIIAYVIVQIVGAKTVLEPRTKETNSTTAQNVGNGRQKTAL